MAYLDILLSSALTSAISSVVGSEEELNQLKKDFP